MNNLFFTCVTSIAQKKMATNVKNDSNKKKFDVESFKRSTGVTTSGKEQAELLVKAINDGATIEQIKEIDSYMMDQFHNSYQSLLGMSSSEYWSKKTN